MGHGATLIYEKKTKMALVFRQLNEKQRRWVAGMLAEYLGHGGLNLITEKTGISWHTIKKGRKDIQQNLEGYSSDRIRKKGAGRPRSKKTLLKMKLEQTRLRSFRY